MSKADWKAYKTKLKLKAMSEEDKEYRNKYATKLRLI